MNIELTTGRKIMGRLFKGDDLLLALGKACEIMGIELGEVRAIGAVSKARVGFYDQADQEYAFIDLAEPLEILSLTGNVSLKDDKPFVHAHVTLSDKEGRAFGGHLAEGTTVFACEFVFQEYRSDDGLVRGLDRGNRALSLD